MDALLLVKATLLLSATLLAECALRRSPAVTRHRLWSAVFAAVLALPVLGAVLPALNVPVPMRWSAAAAPAVAATPLTRDQRQREDTATIAGDTTAVVGQGRSISMNDEAATAVEPGKTRATALLLAVWGIGAAMAMTALVLSLVRTRRLARTADAVNDPMWRSAAVTLAGRLGLRRAVRLLVTSGVDTPMAGGVWRPAIFLPAASRTWSAERRDVVLAHELAHLAARDPLRHLIARLALALYWFHPLAWIAARQEAVAREQACDEAVLALGTRPSVYARVLLDLADSIARPAPALAVLPMVQRSLLENRLMAILNDNATPMSRRLVLAPASALALLTLSVAAAQPAASTVFPAVVATATIALDAGAAAPAASVPAPYAGTRTGLAAAAQPAPGRDSACAADGDSFSSFNGTMSSSNAGGRMVIHEAVGTRGADRVIQKSFGDLRLCMVAEGVGQPQTPGKPTEWIGRATRVVLEARQGSLVQRMELGRPADGGAVASWSIAGVQRPVDDAARQWRERMLAVLDSTWEVSALRGQVSSLAGQISSLQGQRSSLQGEISSLQGEVSSMRGRISSIRGEESVRRGRISAIQGHLSSLQGAISSEQGAISSLNAGRYQADNADRARIDQHQEAIARVEREIRDYDARARIAAVEREIASANPDEKAAAIESDIRAFNLNGKVATIEGRIAALDVEGKVATIERQITALDADRRSRELERRRDDEVQRLEAAIAAIR